MGIKDGGCLAAGTNFLKIQSARQKMSPSLLFAALYDLNLLFWYLERNRQPLIGQKDVLLFSWNQPVPHQEQLCCHGIGSLLFDESDGQVPYARFPLRKEEQTGSSGWSSLCFFLLSWFCHESLSPGFGRHWQARPFARYVQRLADGFLYWTDYL